MIALHKRMLLTIGMVLASGGAMAAEPNVIELPVPRPLGPLAMPMSPMPMDPYAHLPYVRTSHYAVWQYYGVDRQGFFKPLVIYSPYGSYYAGNGKPFPWAPTMQYEWMPKVVDPVPFR